MKRIIYEIAMGILALISVIFAIVDISKGLAEWQILLDNCILVIFFADYIIRLLISKDKKKFVKDNVLDLIAIIPFNSAFRVFRIAKLTNFVRIARIVKLIRIAQLLVYTIRLIKRTQRFFNTNGFKYIVFITMGFILVGGLSIHYAEGLSFQDGIWWAFVTTTTVGYGDISPSTISGRLIAIVLMIVGIGMLGSLTSTITSYFIYNKPRTLKEDVLDNIKSKIDDIQNLSDEDIDDMCNVLKGLNKNYKTVNVKINENI